MSATGGTGDPARVRAAEDRSDSGSRRESTPLRWYHVGSVDEIPRLGARVVRIGDRVIAIFRTSDDRVFALLDRCPHRAGPLSQGIVHGACVTCPLHDWVIDLESGEARDPDEGRTERFPVRTADSEVLLGVPEAAGRNLAAEFVEAAVAAER